MSYIVSIGKTGLSNSFVCDTLDDVLKLTEMAQNESAVLRITTPEGKVYAASEFRRLVAIEQLMVRAKAFDLEAQRARQL